MLLVEISRVSFHKKIKCGVMRCGGVASDGRERESGPKH